jgi:hypothetical protein
VKRLAAAGELADLDDGPDQIPLDDSVVQDAIVALLPSHTYDLILTHGPNGEYTRHRRHEEVSRAVCALWSAGAIRTKELRLFAYEDGHGSHLPTAERDAHVALPLAADVWRTKSEIVQQTYGFGPESFEARTCPRTEAFWTFRSPNDARGWLERKGDRT